MTASINSDRVAIAFQADLRPPASHEGKWCNSLLHRFVQGPGVEAAGNDRARHGTRRSGSSSVGDEIEESTTCESEYPTSYLFSMR